MSTIRTNSITNADGTGAPNFPNGLTSANSVGIGTTSPTAGYRQAAYTAEADPLFFKWQAGEDTEEEWKAKRQEIRDRYPYPTEEAN
jgi:hypothetical protein